MTLGTNLLKLYWAQNSLSAKSYVQDGLIAMWDGIENAGWGVHNGNASTWTNLVGGSIENISLYTQNCEWTNDALVGKDRAFVDSSAVLALGSCPMPNDYKTGEFVLKFGDIVCILFVKGSPDAGNAAVGRFNAIRGFQLAYVNGSAGGMSHIPDTRYYVARTGDDFLSGGMTYKNGRLNTEGFQRSTVSPVDRFGEGFRTNASNAMPYIGEVCAMRFYSRQLTAAEIAHNYAIDKARFNIQ